jgi:hypothetical protein
VPESGFEVQRYLYLAAAEAVGGPFAIYLKNRLQKFMRDSTEQARVQQMEEDQP